MSDQSRERRFTASGLEEARDVHSFATDDLASADAMRALMAEDLDDVTLQDRDD